MAEIERVLWAAHQLFERRQTCGTTGNISFLQAGRLYVSAGGSCFGTMTEDDFCEVTLDGKPLGSRKPSKEWPIHAMLHRVRGQDGVIIHTHGFYATAWSCLPCADPEDAIPAYTPYLRMKAGKVRYVPYAAPGSPELFKRFEEALCKETCAYLLGHHGAVVAAPNAMEAFALIEELEESARMAWHLRGTDAAVLP